MQNHLMKYQGNPTAVFCISSLCQDLRVISYKSQIEFTLILPHYNLYLCSPFSNGSQVLPSLLTNNIQLSNNKTSLILKETYYSLSSNQYQTILTPELRPLLQPMLAMAMAILLSKALPWLNLYCHFRIRVQLHITKLNKNDK